MSPRPILSEDARTPEVARFTANFHGDVIAEITQAIAQQPVVVVGMAQNPFVKKARKALQAAGIDFHYLEYGSYFKGWRRRLAIKMWSGWPTFPQVYVRGTLVGGFDDVERALGDGSLRELLERHDSAA